ncbi:MAG: S9 family peptidase [Chloroflexota bacterium]
MVAPYGSWKSPITSDLIVAETISLSGSQISEDGLYWLEMRPQDGGRIALVHSPVDGTPKDLIASPFNVRTRVHEYGGGAYVASQGTIYFSNYQDQRLYQQVPGSDAQAITPDKALRYADAVVDPTHNRLFCIREDHRGEGEAINTIVTVDCTGDEKGGTVIVSGHDFYASPRLSPDGTQLAWLAWNHPNMPWDGTELWVATVQADGSVSEAEQIAGGLEESIFQPTWSPDGILTFVSDRSGWWNLYRWQDGISNALCPMAAEFGRPQWTFGMSTYVYESAERIICIYGEKGVSQLAAIDPVTGVLTDIATPYTSLGSLSVHNDYALFIGGSPSTPSSLVLLNLASGEQRVLRRANKIHIEPSYLSAPEAIEFPTAEGLTAHAFYYPPCNQDFAAPSGEKPPLLLLSHGGPTGATSATLSMKIQYWTSRGIAVIDVNYGGSTGYGREFRERLNGRWGIVDVDDCVNAARYLVDQGQVDGKRLAIAGGSAGGYTTLCALTFQDTFAAGASHFGVADLEILAQHTHKFESRYLDSLIGPYPERRDIYLERSPIHSVDQLSCPLILFQGLEDKIVPPEQAESMFEAVKGKGLPVAYLPFEGEQHGFRQAQNIKRSLDAELYFYSTVFGFELADSVEPVEIENQ